MRRTHRSDSTAQRPYLRRATPSPARSLALAAAPLALAATAAHPELVAASLTALVAVVFSRRRPVREP